jgi:predicted TIM-barrel fold metal-dependent hydrolase
MDDLGQTALPTTLGAYVRDVVQATLRREREGGAVGIKFEAAYLRPLDFADPDSAAATRIYARYAGGGAPTLAEYRTLEDYLFRQIAAEAGRLELPVQIHALDGFGGYYDARGAQPFLLESVFDDPGLRDTRFVIVHGGWPEIGQTEAMIGKPNVYTDISMMDLILEPSRLALVLRQWLPRWPEKVLFGSDAFDGGDTQSWAEVAAFSTRSARRALALALTGMMRDGEIGRERAEALARMVLRENAERLYRLDGN